MPIPEGQIIAIGGGGLSAPPESSLLDRYILAQVIKTRPKICFIPTASGDSQEYIDNFYASFHRLSCDPSHLSLFRAPTADLRSLILEKDILYVGGGNTKNLLVLWKEWGIDIFLQEAWEKGAVLAGLSAGSICWFKEGVTDSIPGKLTKLDCLGLLEGSNCPHYDSEEERRPAYHRLIYTGEMQAGYAVEDGAALHFTGAKLRIVVSSRPDARAYYVKKGEKEVIETPLDTFFLANEAM